MYGYILEWALFFYEMYTENAQYGVMTSLAFGPTSIWAHSVHILYASYKHAT